MRDESRGLAGVSCTGTSTPTTSGVTIELAAGEDIACTFLNRRVRFPIFLPIIMK